MGPAARKGGSNLVQYILSNGTPLDERLDIYASSPRSKLGRSNPRDLSCAKHMQDDELELAQKIE